MRLDNTEEAIPIAYRRPTMNQHGVAAKIKVRIVRTHPAMNERVTGLD